jgi:hemerythrin superfamily protein
MTSDLEQDVATVLTADHREMERLYEDYQRAEGDPTASESLVRELTRLIVQHALAEEQVLYPVMKSALPDGAEQVAEARDQHKSIERMLEALEQLRADDTAFGETVRALMLEVIPHAREEEEDLFPALREVVGDDEMRSLGAKVERAKKLAPTRPHPLVPSTAPVRTLAAPAAAVSDRIRDALEERARQEEAVGWRRSRVAMLIGAALLALGIILFVRRSARP